MGRYLIYGGNGGIGEAIARRLATAGHDIVLAGRNDEELQALAGEHYYLQYLIYLVALRRFLRQRLADFSDEQLGGAFYLFLRGMPEAGVYFARPDDALLDALDRLFEEGK